MMNPRIVGTGIGFAIGTFFGLATGVAASGDAVNGAFVFGPLGAVVGLFLGDRLAPDPPGDLESPETSRPPPASTFESTLGDAVNAAGMVFSTFLRLLGAIWNLQMRILVGVGAMPFFQRHSWAFAAVGFLLLAVVFPVGVVFTITGFAAMHFEAKAENQFMI